MRQSKFAVSVGTAQQCRGHTKHAMQNYNIRVKNYEHAKYSTIPHNTVQSTINNIININSSRLLTFK